MSSLLPQRVKDLPQLDSEDERTPLKYKKSSSLNQNSMVDKFNVLPFCPKRVSELPQLSDSEPDEDSKIDSFNCALLDESFIISPSKNKSFCKENNKKSLYHLGKEIYSKDTGYGDSISLDINSLNISCENEQMSTEINFKTKKSLTTEALNIKNDKEFCKQKNPGERLPFTLFNKAKLKIIQGDQDSFIGLPEQSKSPLDFGSEVIFIKKFNSISKNKKNLLCSENNKDFKQLKNSFSKKHDSHIPNQVSEISNDENLSDNTLNIFKKTEPKVSNTNQHSCQKLETSNKISEINFVTPHIKSINIVRAPRRPILLGSTTNKTKSAIENEFRTPKVLFQTPYAASRPPVSSITNNSISLGLDDTTVKPETSQLKMNDSNKPSQDLLKSLNKVQNVNDLIENDIKNDLIHDNSKKDVKVILINGKEYLIYKQLGSGGSSSVFLAERKDIKKQCAVKIVDLRGDKTVVEGYLNETKLLAKLQGNINVVSLFEYQHLKEESTLYMVMEKGDSDLHKILQSYKTDLPLHVLMSLWYQMLLSVEYIHQNGVIHSDLKPANFLMVDDRLKLIDFGIASNISIDSTSIIKFTQAGTFNYISPEALIDTSNSSFDKDKPKIKISTKSDVWSLGCILYLLLYKNTPFGNIKNIYAKVHAISNPNTVINYQELPSYYPPMLIEMAKSCLIHNPKKRMSVSEILKYPFDMVIPLNK